jgi:methionine aminopeptidase
VLKYALLQNICDLRPPVSVDVSMNTTRPLRRVLLATRKGLRLAIDAMKPGKLEDKLEKYEQIKDLAAMRHYEGWQHDCHEDARPSVKVLARANVQHAVRVEFRLGASAF